MIIIKAGGSAITDKKRPFSVKEDALATLSRELSNSNEEVVICHGGGSFGHPLAKKHNVSGHISSSEQLQGVSKINIAMRRLSNIFSDALEKGGCRPFVLQSSAIMQADKGRITKFDCELIGNIARKGFIPILYGDVVYDDSFSFSIISGDQIMRRLAQCFPDSRAIFLADVNGIYTSDPKLDKNANHIREIRFDDIPSIDAGTADDMTGGMKGKLDEIMHFKGYVSEIIITELGREGSLSMALKGGNPGTRIIR